MYKVRAQDTIFDTGSTHWSRSAYKGVSLADINKCGGLLSEIELAVGSRTMLQRNYGKQYNTDLIMQRVGTWMMSEEHGLMKLIHPLVTI